MHIPKETNDEIKSKRNKFSLVLNVGAEESMCFFNAKFHKFLSSFIITFFIMCVQSYEPLQIYKETSLVYVLFLLQLHCMFSFQHIILETVFVLSTQSQSRLFIYLSSFDGFSKNPGRVCPIKLKIGILYHMSNIFQHTFFKIPVSDWVFKCYS